MSNSIGGNLEISAIMDASGIQTGASRGEQSMADLSASAERMEANLAGVGGETVALTSSLSNAAKMVELLSAKMLSGSAAAATARRATNANVQQELGLGPSRNPADSNAMAQLRMEIEERNRFNSVRIRQAAELTTELASYARQEAAEEERIRAETLASLRRDIESRSAMERQRVTEQAGYARQEAADEERIRAETLANLRRDIEERSAMERQRVTEQASYARQEAADEERIRAETMANLRRDIESRSAMERQRVTEQAGYARQEAADEERIRAETMANLRRDIESRAAAEQRDRDDRLNFRMNNAQNAGGRSPVQAMEESILRMRAELNPMVGMQARLAQEALEFRQHMNNAVISGRLTWQNAQQLTAEFQQQQVLLRQQAIHQQQGFLGMRRMGFAAQQFGYAIEDAASVWGTMGMAGAFRAAGNNLTAMGALMGPQVGVLASLAAAGVSLGINLYEAKKKAAELVDENKELKKLTEDITSRMEYRIGIESQLRSARTASHEELMTQYQQNLEKIHEIDAAEKARLGTINQLIDLTTRNNELKEVERKISEDNALWWREQFNWSLHAWEYMRDAGSGMLSLLDTADAAKLAEERFNAEAKIAIEMAHQQALLDKANSAEQKRLELLHAQFEVLKIGFSRIPWESLTENHNGGGRLLGDGIRNSKAYAGEFDVTDGRTMHVKQDNYAGDRMNLSISQAGSDALLQLAQQRLAAEHRQLIAQREATTDLEEQKRLHAEIAGIAEERLRVDKMRVELNKVGERSFESANNSVSGRFESFNEELRIENEILRTRKKLNEELDIAVRSRHMDQKQAEALRGEMEQAFQIEKERRDNEKAIVDLKKRESQLQSNVRQDLSPATALGGLQRGSDETRAFLENERLRGMAQKDAEPQIVELKKIRDEIKRLREANEKSATSRPKVAAIF